MTDTHRFYLESAPIGSGNTLRIGGEEARHAAKVKRVRVGDPVGVLDGAGLVASGTVLEIGPAGGARGSTAVVVRIDASARHDPPRPAVHVIGATPKGRRVDEMIDALSQAGAASWRPLRSERVVVDPRDTKVDRLTRIAIESSKQCARAWMMLLARAMTFDDAITPAPDTAIVIADGSGAPYQASGAREIRLVIGPEGGLSERELMLARERGATVAGFGRHTMRIETAAVVATGIVIDRERRDVKDEQQPAAQGQPRRRTPEE